MVFLHSGKIGDCIYSLPAVMAKGGGTMYLKAQTDSWFGSSKAGMILLPLLNAQPYITEASLMPNASKEKQAEWEKEHIDVNLNRFRDYEGGLTYRYGRDGRKLNLVEYHLKAFDLDLSLSNKQWLFVDKPVSIPKRPIVISKSVGKSARPNLQFKWLEIAKKYASQAVFVGLQSEYSDFCTLTQSHEITYYPTHDFLDVARIIAGSDLFIGNQSAPYAVAEGLKHNSILSISHSSPDCIFERDNGRYCFKYPEPKGE